MALLRPLHLPARWVYVWDSCSLVPTWVSHRCGCGWWMWGWGWVGRGDSCKLVAWCHTAETVPPSLVCVIQHCHNKWHQVPSFSEGAAACQHAVCSSVVKYRLVT